MTFTDVDGEFQNEQAVFTVEQTEWPFVRCSSSSGPRTYLWWDMLNRLTGYGLTLEGDPDELAADMEWLRREGVLRRIATIADDIGSPTDERVEDIKNLAYIL